MNLARVIGNVVATAKDPGLVPLPLLIVQPLTPQQEPKGSPLIATDRIGVGPGEIVILEKSKEAGLGLAKNLVPTDLSIVGKVDAIRLEISDSPSDPTRPRKKGG